MMEDLPQSLVNGGDCNLHFHSADRLLTHDSLASMQHLARQVVVTGNYTVTSRDDLLLVGVTANVTLPLARNGKEFEVVCTAAGITVTVLLTSPDTIYGESSVLLTTRGMALRFKAISGGWILI